MTHEVGSRCDAVFPDRGGKPTPACILLHASLVPLESINTGIFIAMRLQFLLVQTYLKPEKENYSEMLHIRP